MAIVRSTTDLVQIVMNGGGLSLDCGGFTVQTLVQLAMNLQPNSRLVLRNSGVLTTENLVQIAMNGGGKVIFEM